MRAITSLPFAFRAACAMAAVASALSAQVHSYRETPVSFRSAGERIGGVLCLPPGDGPFPLVVFVAGSGASRRDGSVAGIGGGLRPHLWDALARKGIASLGWDKPGVGDSTGDWRNQTMDDRAREVVAAVRWAKSRPEVDARRIALLGASQAGWVMPIACHLAADDIALMIAVSVPVGSGYEQELYRVERGMPAEGFSTEETKAAVDFTRRRLALLEADASFSRIDSLQRELDGKPWAWFVGVLDEANARFLSGGPSSRRAREQLAAQIAKIRCPVLAVFGAKDTIVDGADSARVYPEVLARAGNRDVTILTFPDADHAMLRTATGSMSELLRSVRQPDAPFAPGYVEAIVRWLEERCR